MSEYGFEAPVWWLAAVKIASIFQREVEIEFDQVSLVDDADDIKRMDD